MKSTIRPLLLMAIMIGSLSLLAQKKPLVEDKNDVLKRASEAFKSSMKAPEGNLYLFGRENNIKGVYEFKVTLGDRGKVVSIFVLNREGGDIKMQNMLKDAVKETKFDFKLPKNKDYSFTYSFKF